MSQATRKKVTCPRCGGELKQVAGLMTCQVCGERSTPMSGFRREHGRPALGMRSGQMIKPIIDDD